MLRVFSFSQAFYSGRGKLSINTAWESWLTLPLGRDEKENHSKPQSVFSIAVDLQFDSVVSGAKDGEGDRRGQGGADLQPRIARGNRGKGVARRFRRVIHVVDSTTIQLVASCMDWAKHRRRKAAAKCHLRLDLHSFLPRFAMILSAAFIKWLRGKVLQPVMQGDQVLFQLS